MHTQSYIKDLDGHTLLLRNAREEEAELLLQNFRTVCGETRFLLREPEEITVTLEQERSFIRSQNEEPGNLLLLGFLDGEYAGNCSFNGKTGLRSRHRAVVGIALLQKFTGRGIGTVMLETLIREAEKAGFEQLELEVVAGNERAMGLYEKMGFVKYGTFPRNLRYKDGTYADAHWMMKSLRKDPMERKAQQITVEPIEGEEAIGQALELAWDVFLKYEGPDYTGEGIAEFYKSIHDREFRSRLTFYGARREGKLLGVMATRSGGSHIAMLFVDGAHHRQGIGRRLVEEAVRENTAGCLTVNASPCGIPFYHKLGFRDTDAEQAVNGLRFTPMKMMQTDPVRDPKQEEL